MNLTRETLALLEEVAKRIKGSSVVPHTYRDSAQDIFLVLMAGHEYGFNTLQSLKAFHIIQGEVSIATNAMLAVVQRSPHYVRHEVTNRFPDEGGALNNGHGVKIRIWRKGNKEPFVGTYTVEEAKQEGLWGRSTWQKMPRWMIRMRAISRAVKEGFSDVIHGLQDKEGMEDYSDSRTKKIPAVSASEYDKSDTRYLNQKRDSFLGSIVKANPKEIEEIHVRSLSASASGPVLTEEPEIVEIPKEPELTIADVAVGKNGGNPAPVLTLEDLDKQADALFRSLCRGIHRMGEEKLNKLGEHPKMIALKHIADSEPECQARQKVQEIREEWKMRMTELRDHAGEVQKVQDIIDDVFSPKEEDAAEEEDPAMLDAWRQAMAKDGPLTSTVPGDQDVKFEYLVDDKKKGEDRA